MRLDRPDPFSSFDFTDHQVLIIAVSGGSDSLALLLLARHFVHDRAPWLRLVAVTVDHALRARSAAEARQVAAICARLGIEHRIMVWHGRKPDRGLAAAAREARYALLAQAARQCGSTVVMTGHTMDDQAETVAMRAARGDGCSHGSAGMAACTLFDETIWIVRPLLNVRRDDLRAFLAAQTMSWIDDPSNENEASERVRVRRHLAEARSVERLWHIACDKGRERTELSAAAADLIARHAARPAPGLWRVSRGIFEESETEASLHAFRILLAVAGGTAFLPDAARSRALGSGLSAGNARATLSRSVVDARAGWVWLHRERRDLPMARSLDEDGWWDGRVRWSATPSGAGLSICACGDTTDATRATHSPQLPRGLVGAAFAAEPGLWREGVLLAHATSEDARDAGFHARPAAALFGRYLPGFDLDAARAIHALLGAAPLAHPPLVKHNV